MSKLRLLFEKQGTACYISHLDLMRTFQRLFLRGGMFIKHSKNIKSKDKNIKYSLMVSY